MFNSPGVRGLNQTPQTAQDYRGLTVAKITSVNQPSGGPLAGLNVYGWIEQTFNPATGLNQNASPPRVGTFTSDTVFPNCIIDLNNALFTVGEYVWVRMKGLVGGNIVYESNALNGSGNICKVCIGSYCAFLSELPNTTCLLATVTEVHGKCDCVHLGQAVMLYYNAGLGGWVGGDMMSTCCGCGVPLFTVNDPDNLQASLVLKGVHTLCGSGSGSGGDGDITLKMLGCGRDAITGKPGVFFYSSSDLACNDPILPCENYFVIFVECTDCPVVNCGCCCLDFSPSSWLFQDSEGGWWSLPQVPNSLCTWQTTCDKSGGTASLTYNSGEGLYIFNAPDGSVYTLAEADWECHGTGNLMNKISGPGPSQAGLIPLYADPGVGPFCVPPDTMTITVTSSGCANANFTRTLTKVSSGLWSYSNLDDTEVTGINLNCANGQYSIAATIVCVDGSVTVDTYTLSGNSPDLLIFTPFDMEWDAVSITGDNAHNECCDPPTTARVVITG